MRSDVHNEPNGFSPTFRMFFDSPVFGESVKDPQSAAFLGEGSGYPELRRTVTEIPHFNPSPFLVHLLYCDVEV